MKPILFLAASLLAAVEPAGAAGIGPIQHPPQHHASSPKRGSLFPLLTKLRDEAIEFVFGRHPTKDSTYQPVPDNLRALYANELVLRFNVSTPEEEDALSKASSRLFLDVWAFTDKFVDIRLHSDEVGPLLSLLPRSLHASQSTLIPDLAAAVYQSLPAEGPNRPVSPESVYADLSIPPNAGGNLFFQDYQPLNVVVRWMQLLEAMFPSYVKYITIGKSFEGRDIPGLRVGVPVPVSPFHPRKTIVFTGGLHGREWISTSTINYLAWSFITAFGKEPLITKLLEHFDVVFIPSINPDGTEYTWQVDRLWRKTRQQTNLRYCRGLDLDHAFSYEWESAHVHDDPCSESYGGEEPFQAAEAKALADWARNETVANNARFVGLVDFHSYSQQILFPYAFSCAVEPPNLENLEELAAGLSKSIRLSTGEIYSISSACRGAVTADDLGDIRRMEAGGGSAMDWFYHDLHAHFSYQIKLRDTGSYGFLLPKEHIVPTGEEILDAMKYFVDYLLGNNGIERFDDQGVKPPAEKTEDSSPQDGTDSTDGFELRRRRMRR